SDDGRRNRPFARGLAGADMVGFNLEHSISFNLCRSGSGNASLKSREMSAEKVSDFVLGFRLSASSAAVHDYATFDLYLDGSCQKQNCESGSQDHTGSGDILSPTSFVGCGGIPSLRSRKLANLVEDIGWFLADRKIGLGEGASDDAALIYHESRRDWQHPLG